MMRGIKVGFRCDAGPRIGVGHLMRCVALAEELDSWDVEVVFLSNLGGLEWAERQVAARGYSLIEPQRLPQSLLRQAASLSLHAIVLDSYELHPATGQTLKDGGVATLLVHDGDTRGQAADIYVDQNLGAEHLHHALPDGARSLAGLEYALLRDEVRCQRPSVPPTAEPIQVPRILCFFGGTDPFQAAAEIGAVLIETGEQFHATVVAASESVAARLQELPLKPGQALEIIPPTDHLPRLAAEADLVISASGTSTWEMISLGASVALVWVVDNQESGYKQVVSARLAEGLGHVAHLSAAKGRHHAVTTLITMMRDPNRRSELAKHAWETIDGRGRERVAEVLISFLAESVVLPRHTGNPDSSESSDTISS